MKKLLSLSLALIMLFAFIPAAMTASAEEKVKVLTADEIDAGAGKYAYSCTKSTGTLEEDGYTVKLDFGSTGVGNQKCFYIGIPSSVFDLNPTKIVYNLRANAGYYAGYYNWYFSSQYQCVSTQAAQPTFGARIVKHSQYNGISTTTKPIEVSGDMLDAIASPDATNTSPLNYFALYNRNDSGLSSPATVIYIDSIEVYYEGEVETEKDGLTTDAIATQDSASIRINEVSGMRFYTTVDTEALADLGEVTERGTLIGPADKVGTYLTIEDTEIPEGETVGNAVVVKYDLAEALWKNGENDEMVGSLVGIQEKNYTRDFVARAYVVVDGTYYYSTTVAQKNVAGIADECVGTDFYNGLSDENKALVDTWAAAND